MAKFQRQDRTGNKYGMLTVLEFSHADRQGVSFWLCECECGRKKAMCTTSLNRAKSCGCLSRLRVSAMNTTHGQKYHPLYKTWAAMRTRCNNPKGFRWEHYGGRGIKICDRWNDILKFAEDMGPKPSASHSLDRIDVNGNYSPENCRWASRSDQANNKRTSHFLEYKGEIKTISQWSASLNIPLWKFKSQLKKGIADNAVIPAILKA